MKGDMKRFLVLSIAGLLVAIATGELPAMGQKFGTILGDDANVSRNAKLFSALQQVADEQDKSPSKDWFKTGQSSNGPRIFKTGYGRMANSIKAAFAYDLDEFTRNRGEALLKDINSYIPYSKREAFASSWWTRHSKAYCDQAPWDKESWKQEALQDATKLRYWAGKYKLSEAYGPTGDQIFDGLLGAIWNKSESY